MDYIKFSTRPVVPDALKISWRQFLMLLWTVNLFKKVRALLPVVIALAVVFCMSLGVVSFILVKEQRAVQKRAVAPEDLERVEKMIEDVQRRLKKLESQALPKAVDYVPIKKMT